MRSAYEDQEDRKERADFGIDRAYDFDYAHVGEIIERAIYDRSVPNNIIKDSCEFLKKEKQ